MSKFLKKVGDLPLSTSVKCFGHICIIISHQDSFCVLCSKDAVFNVPFSQIVELIKIKHL